MKLPEMKAPEPLTRLSFPTADLMALTPPKFYDPNKQAVYALACPDGTAHSGTLVYSRWAEMKLPAACPAQAPRCIAQAGRYDYAPSTDPARIEWHVNFADPNLFYAYAGSLMAQDETQVLEHPALGALREALVKRGEKAVTEDNTRPTPVLVMDVERRCALALEPNAAAGRPDGLYGNKFARATPADAVRATRVLNPPTRTNVIAMAALSHGRGAYKVEEIEFTLATAYTAFYAAKLESARAWAEAHAAPSVPGPQTVIHTGFWGCGAFGGDRELMALLQLLAARLAGIDELDFHAFDEKGRATFEAARQTLDALAPAGAELPLSKLIQQVVAHGFEWGYSDGN